MFRKIKEFFSKGNKLQELRWDCEVEMAIACDKAESEARKNGGAFTCTCELPDNWDEAKCLEYLGRSK